MGRKRKKTERWRKEKINTEVESGENNVPLPPVCSFTYDPWYTGFQP